MRTGEAEIVWVFLAAVRGIEDNRGIGFDRFIQDVNALFFNFVDGTLSLRHLKACVLRVQFLSIDNYSI